MRSKRQLRLVAELYRLAGGGLVFLDIGWADPLNPGHPEHRLPEADGGGPLAWKVGEFVIRVIVPSVEPELVREWGLWREVRERLNASREAGRTYIESAVGPTIPD